MARSFEDILAEVSSKSDPQRQLVLKQVADLPTQQAAEESALGAKKDQAYEDILAGARRRGLGFSGIPLGEQARYEATDYAPAVANLKSSFNNRKTTLEAALADIGKSDYTTAQDIFGRDRAFEEQQRQFNEQQAFAREQAARQAAQSSALAGLYSNNQPLATPRPQGGGVQISPQLQQLYNQVFIRPDGSAWSDKDLVSDYNATLKSAMYGNERDKQKIQLYHATRPDLFGGAVPSTGLFSNTVSY